MKLFLLFLSLSLSGRAAGANDAIPMLDKASRSGDLKAAEALLSSGVDPNSGNRSGRTPLYYAALYNRNDIAALLLAHGADPNTRANGATPSVEFPETPLQIAASMGNLHIVSMLVTAGAHVDAKAETGHTALHFAVVGSHLDVIRFLIDHGADVSTRDVDGATPLDDAVWRGYLEATAILLAKGARLNEAETKTGATPINEAAYRGEAQLVRYLLRFDPNLEIPDKQGYTPLQNAIRRRNQEPALLLLDAASLEQRTPESLNELLDAAIKKDESVVVEALLQHGALVNGLLSSGATPADVAASAGAIKTVSILLNDGADPNRSGRNGTSPLEDAALRGFEPIVGLLLDHDAQVNQVNNASGSTALYAAASFGKSDVVKLLLERGANPALCGRNRKSAYQAALAGGYKNIAEQIETRGGAKSCE